MDDGEAGVDIVGGGVKDFVDVGIVGWGAEELEPNRDFVAFAVGVADANDLGVSVVLSGPLVQKICQEEAGLFFAFGG